MQQLKIQYIIVYGTMRKRGWVKQKKRFKSWRAKQVGKQRESETLGHNEKF